MLNKKSNKGITLIALIITIVVMLILVAVTLMIALGENGVITTTKNAKNEHELAAFKEYVEIAAAGHYEPNYDWKADMDFKGGKYDWLAIQEEIRREYPETNFIFNLLNLPQGAANASSENIWLIEAEIYCSQAIIDYIEENELSTNTRLTTEQKNSIQNACDAAKQKFVNDNPDSNLTVDDITTGTGSGWTGNIIIDAAEFRIMSFGPGSSMIAEYNGTAVPIGFVNTNMYDYYVIMKKSEAEKLFEFTYTTENGAQIATVKRYKGNSKNVKVPGTLIEENGDTILVKGIEDYAFVKTNLKVGVMNLMADMDIDDTDYDEVFYNDTATLAEFKAFFDAPEDIYYCEHTELGDACTSKLCKNELLKVVLVMMAGEAGIDVTADNVNDYLTVDSENTLYVYLRVVDMDSGEMTPITPAEYQESNVQTVLVSEGIQSIGDSFMNCTKLKEIYLPDSIETSGDGTYYSHFSIGESTFSGCNSLTIIKTMNEKIANFSRDWGCPNDIKKIYIEPVLEN